MNATALPSSAHRSPARRSSARRLSSAARPGPARSVLAVVGPARPVLAVVGLAPSTSPLSRRLRLRALVGLLLTALLVGPLGLAGPAAASDARSPAGSWSAATPRTIDASAVASLEVREPGASTDYDREAFGKPWADVDDNGCDTRNDILARDMSRETLEGDCKVLTGVLKDPYTGEQIDFDKSKGSNQIDIDHMIPLGAAWEAGASEWTDEQRLQYANDPLVLLAVDSGANRSKSDQTISEWMPTNTAIACQYGASYVAIALKYELSVSPADHDKLEELSGSCG